MTVGELREILNDPLIPDHTPVRLASSDGRVWAVELVGAHGALAGPDPQLMLELEPRP
jgi:hypothetical protein